MPVITITKDKSVTLYREMTIPYHQGERCGHACFMLLKEGLEKIADEEHCGENEFLIK